MTTLEVNLASSNDADRKRWASIIVSERFDVRELSQLLRCDEAIAIRFQWLLSDVGTTDRDTLLHALPYLFSIRHQIEYIDFERAFATYWMIVGVTQENESQAIDLLLQWLRSANTNVTTKLRSLKAVLVLTQKYPELENELRLSLQDQLDEYPENFRQKAEAALKQLKA